MKMALWYALHRFVNRLAWHFASPRGAVVAALDTTHPLWRLNDWLANRWIPAWVAQRDKTRSADRADA